MQHLNKQVYYGVIGGILLAAGLILFTVVRSNSHAATAGGIFCAEPQYDFGFRDNRQTIEHTFVIQNSGSEPLDIHRVEACCGVSAVCSVSRINPRETAEIIVQFPLIRRKGVLKKKIKIHSGDLQYPVYTLTLSGTAVASVYAEPVMFGLIRPGEAVSTNLIIHGIEPAKAQLCFTTQDFSIEKQPSEDPSCTMVVIKGLAGSYPEALSGILQVRTEPGGDSVLDIPVSGIVGWPLLTFPETIEIHPDEPGYTGSCQVILISRDQKPFEIIKTETDAGDVQTDILPIKPGACRLEIRGIDPESSQLQITVLHRNQSVILSLPVRGGNSRL